MDAANQLVFHKTVVRSERELIEEWLEAFEAALHSRDSSKIATLFAAESHWRDLVAFTWSITPRQGAKDIAALMAARQEETRARAFAIAEGRTPPRRLQRAGF